SLHYPAPLVPLPPFPTRRSSDLLTRAPRCTGSRLSFAFPPPACGERVASSEAVSRVRGPLPVLSILRIPLTRRAVAALRCADLSPQAGRGKLWHVLALICVLIVAPSSAQSPQSVDLALVLAVDA